MSKGGSRTLSTTRAISSKNDDDDNNNFLSKLSRERHNPLKQGDASFRVPYYGGAHCAVPFLWESEPGTPKHRHGHGPITPPLTPPPYYFSGPHAQSSKTKTRSSSSNVINSIFPKMPSSKKFNKLHNSNSNSSPLFSPHSSSSSSSSSYSVPSTPVHARSNIIARDNDDDEDADDHDVARARSPTSTLCFGPKKIKGCYYPIKSVKKVVMSMVGQGN
ncbi:Unknown protein [Striga hermonthica]|uniref:Uncharacterized protein n=1 Tax=Striga hermonthica TaxID=68872 RepID=A0A9N7NM81_STRHE|nr:Unknown protein [Striga hermonthica]